MTTLTDTTRPVASSRVRPARYASLAVAGTLAVLSGMVPVVVFLLQMH